MRIPGTRQLLKAIRDGDLPTVNRLLDKEPRLLATTFGNRGWSPMHHAALCLTGETLKLLLGRYQEAEDENRKLGNMQVWAESDLLWDLLCLAAERRDAAIVRVLCEHDVEALVRARDWDHPVLAAARAGNREAIDVLLSYGQDVNGLGAEDKTAAIVAAETGNLELLQFLHAEGCKLDMGPEWGVNGPMGEAICEGHVHVVEYLLSLGLSAEIPGARGFTAVDCALDGGQGDMLEFLAGRGVPGAWEARFLYLAGGPRCGEFEEPNIAAAEGALRTDPDLVHARDCEGQTALHRAAFSQRIALMEVLLEYGADPNAVDKSGETPLASGAWGSNRAVIDTLLDRGAQVNAGEVTALHSTAGHYSQELVRHLVQKGARVDPKDPDGNTPLHWCAERSGCPEVAQALVEAGARINPRNIHRSTPLHLAAKEGNEGMCGVLLQHGAMVNARDDAGRTPLHLAVRSDHQGIATLLLRHNA